MPWVPYEFPDATGLLGQATFSGPGAPTLRAKQP